MAFAGVQGNVFDTKCYTSHVHQNMSRDIKNHLFTVHRCTSLIHHHVGHNIINYSFKPNMAQMDLMLDFELDEDSVPYAVPIHMAAGALPSPPIPSSLYPVPSQPDV
jgi:hypothetical protein